MDRLERERLQREWAKRAGPERPAPRPDVGGMRSFDGQRNGPVLTIDCGTCELAHTSACADCVVSFVCDRQAGQALVIDVAEARAIRLLSRAGLVPELRHRRRAG